MRDGYFLLCSPRAKTQQASTCIKKLMYMTVGKSLVVYIPLNQPAPAQVPRKHQFVKDFILHVSLQQIYILKRVTYINSSILVDSKSGKSIRNKEISESFKIVKAVESNQIHHAFAQPPRAAQWRCLLSCTQVVHTVFFP